MKSGQQMFTESQLKSAIVIAVGIGGLVSLGAVKFISKLPVSNFSFSVWFVIAAVGFFQLVVACSDVLQKEKRKGR